MVYFGFGQLVVFSLYFIAHSISCNVEKVSLLQFGGNHSLGNTYSVALVCCLEISSFKVGFNVRKLTVMLPMLMFLCHGGRCDSLYLTGDNVNVAI